ncbi:MAG TPA: FtsW/RodA/SpoVE family cell cycle protein, partial [Gaiellaceae bacterium]|nr:FtsW/RodA/SpoVE family cell cycle protein [Gaiellaceae bacterium]
NRTDQIRVPVTAVALALPPILLVFAQPDLGSALVYVAALFACLFVGGIRWSQLGVIAGVAAFVAVSVLWLLPSAGMHVLKPYQVSRLTGFLNPSSDPAGATYNVTQAEIAVGSGGTTGRGTLASSQTNLNYLPESQTDFAFAAFAEQRGFLGVSGLLLLYLLVVWRGLKIVTVARDAFSAIVAAGIVFGFVFQIFVNVGMTVGLAPVTGITLPFVSVGGSSLIASMAMIGLLQSIHLRGRQRRA